MKNDTQLKLSDPLLFLFGNRSAIQRLAQSWYTIVLGALLVITAGLARNYDHHHLLTEWKWLYGPYIASLITSVIIYILSCNKHRRDKSLPYFTFLALYWMTSPCAWLYALPIESFTDIVTATRWNIGFLAIVALWRVLLVSRFVSVITGEKYLVSLLRIAWPAAGIMCVASFFKGLELVGIMGGIELAEHEAILAEAAAFTMYSCFYVALIGLIAHAIYFSHSRTKTPDERPNILTKRSRAESPFPKSLFIATTILITLALTAIYALPFQTQTKNNKALRELYRDKKYTEVVAYASALKREDFLEHHEFPPGRNKMFYAFTRVLPLLWNTTPETPQWLIEEWFKSVQTSKYGITKERLNEMLTDESVDTPTDHQKMIKQRIIDQLQPE